MIYLAAPYNDPDPAVVQARIEIIYHAMAEFMKDGKHVVTPLFMHEIVVRHKLNSTYEYWEKYCFDVLKRCDEMIVLCLPGWTDSRGIKDEMEFCQYNNIKVTFVECFNNV